MDFHFTFFFSFHLCCVSLALVFIPKLNDLPNEIDKSEKNVIYFEKFKMQIDWRDVVLLWAGSTLGWFIFFLFVCRNYYKNFDQRNDRYHLTVYFINTSTSLVRDNFR